MRYIILVILNLPVIGLAMMNVVTRYKLGKSSKHHFYKQLIMWLVILGVLIMSYPLFNLANNRPIFDSSDLSAINIVEIVAIVALLYSVNIQRQHIEATEHRLRELHQELSIKLSADSHDKK